ncbi:AMP-binding protein [Ferroplasma sp.]|uniref:AMP-binding protein n=1 Tax=Ferroplasma sp. TaxID=2591003 RepID=UPI00307EFBD8
MGNGFTIIDILRRASSIFPENKVIYGKNYITYRKLFQEVSRIATSMNKMGISNGTVIAVADYNSKEFMELLFASSMTGSVIYPVNIKLPWNMAMETVKESGSEYVFASEEFLNAGMGKSFEADHVISISNNDNYIKFKDLLNSDIHREERTGGNDNYSILFTSGTTGKPKEVLYTNEKAVNGGLSILYQLGLFKTPASLNYRDKILSLIPFYHIWSWGSAFHAAYLGTDYIMTGKYNAEKVLNEIKKNKVTWINAVPTMVYDLIAHDKENILSGIKMLIGGSPINSGLAKALNARNIKFSTIYGGTDMLATSISLGKAGDETLRSVTYPVPMVDATVRDGEGKIVDNGNIGELWVKAPWLPGKYLNHSDGNEYENGWFKTGDVASMASDGGIKILDRVKDVIKSGGEWIPTSIIESIISEYPGIEIAAATGIEDEKWGEKPVAWLKVTETINIQDLREFMELKASKGHINKWWIPVEFIIIEEMPLTSTGKIDKAALRKIK